MEITLDRRQLKREARESIRGRKPSTFLVTLVFFLILSVLDLLSLKLQYPGMTLLEIGQSGLSEEGVYALLQAGAQQSFFSNVLSFAINVMAAVVTAGFVGYTLNVSRNAPGGIGDLLDAFSILIKVVWLNLVMYVFIMLWSLLLIVPGILAAYRYSMAMLILLDDPDKPVMDCIRESKAMTMGHKGELFLLDLSFIGWGILSAIPFVGLYTMPYMMVTKANYYKVLSGRSTAPWMEGDTGTPQP